MDSTMMNRMALLVCLALTLAGGALAQGRNQPTGSPPPTSAAAPAGTVQGRAPLPPASQAVPRGARTFARCNAEALKRRLRGAERRHFVQRCRLGFGMRLFRRRSAPPPVVDPS